MKRSVIIINKYVNTSNLFHELRISRNKEISGNFQNTKELQPNAQSPFENENLANTSKKLLKNRNWTFPVVRYFTWKVQFASNTLSMIVAGYKLISSIDYLNYLTNCL